MYIVILPPETVVERSTDEQSPYLIWPFLHLLPPTILARPLRKWALVFARASAGYKSSSSSSSSSDEEDTAASMNAMNLK